MIKITKKQYSWFFKSRKIEFLCSLYLFTIYILVSYVFMIILKDFWYLVPMALSTLGIMLSYRNTASFYLLKDDVFLISDIDIIKDAFIDSIFDKLSYFDKLKLRRKYEKEIHNIYYNNNYFITSNKYI